MFVTTPLVARLQARAVNEDLANRRVAADGRPCSACFAPNPKVAGHGRGCYLKESAR